MSTKHLLTISSLAVMAMIGSTPVLAKDSLNNYTQTNLVASKASYNALMTDEKFINAWGIAIRPAGAGGHFWVTAADISFEYVGDVQQSPEPAKRVLYQDALKEVGLPIGTKENFATGVVFNNNPNSFIITQSFNGEDAIKAQAKFIFASDGGIISAWTERKNADGSFDWPDKAITVVDASVSGAQFFGLALNKANDRLYAADFGENPMIRVYDAAFKPMAMAFEQPFDTNKNGKVDPGEYAPFNIQGLATPDGSYRLFVTYAMTQVCPEEEITAGTCARGALFVGEEDTSRPGLGKVAEFTEEGKLVALWNDGGKLSAPWGITYAPADFGRLSNTLLVANFGDANEGTIAAFDAKTRRFIDYMRNGNGHPIVIDKVWGLQFGNGVHLGDSNALYFAAGPKEETEGLFGSLRVAASKE